MSVFTRPRPTATVRRRRVAVVVVAALAGVLGLVAVGPTAAGASGPHRQRVPANFIYLETESDGRCGWGIGIEYPAVAKAVGYDVQYYDGYWQSMEYGSVSTPVAHTKGMTKGMNYFGVTGGNGPAPCDDSDPTEGGRFAKGAKVWAVFAHKQSDGYIEGKVTDEDDSGSAKHRKQDSPAEGVEVKAYGGGHHYSAVSGPGGIYFMKVKPGSYRVVPEDTGDKKGEFTPTYSAVHVKKDETAHADFRLKAGLKVTVTMSHSSVAADGMHVVKATVKATRYGKPARGASIQLTVQPHDEDSALTTAPKVAMCGDSGRIWPTSTMSDDLNLPVSVFTDGKGEYHLTLAAGTVPGGWSLEAWGRNDDGNLSSDAAKASDTKKLSLEALTPTTSRDDFVNELDLLKSQQTWSGTDPAYLASTLSGLAAGGHTTGVHLGGLAYSVANSQHGTVLLVSSAKDAPRVKADSSIANTSATKDDLVLDPAEWDSLQNGGLSLQQALQAGEIKGLPTLAQWEKGTSVAGWSGTAGMAATVPNQGYFQQFGWTYGTTCT